MKLTGVDTLEIVAEVNGALYDDLRADPFASAHVETFVRQRTKELIEDLGASQNQSVSISLRRISSPQGPSPHRTFIDGQLCRQPIRRTPSDAEALANDVATIVFDNRQLLLASTVLTQIEGLSAFKSTSSDAGATLDVVVKQGIALGYGLPSIGRFMALLVDKADLDAAKRGSLTPAGVLRPTAEFDSQLSFQLLVAPDLYVREATLKEQFANICDEIYEELGLEMPQLLIAVDGGLPPGQLRARLNDVRAPLCSAAGQSLKLEALKAQIVKYAPMIATDALIEYTLGKLNKAFPMLVFSLIETKGVGLFAAVVRELLAQRVSVRDLRSVLDAVLAANGAGPLGEVGMRTVLPSTARIIDCDVTDIRECSPRDYAEYVRVSIRERVNQAVAVDSRLTVHRVSDELESLLIAEGEKGIGTEFREAILQLVPHAAEGPGHAIVTTTTAGCRILRNLISMEFPELPLFSDRERGRFVTWVEGDPVTLGAWQLNVRPQSIV